MQSAMQGRGSVPERKKRGADNDWLERYHAEDDETWKAVLRLRVLWPSRRTARKHLHMNGLFGHLRAMSMK